VIYMVVLLLDSAVLEPDEVEPSAEEIKRYMTEDMDPAEAAATKVLAFAGEQASSLFARLDRIPR
jgi:hypothetical protein